MQNASKFDLSDLGASSVDLSDLGASAVAQPQPSLADRQAASKAAFEANQPESHLGMNLSASTLWNELKKRISGNEVSPREAAEAAARSGEPASQLAKEQAVRYGNAAGAMSGAGGGIAVEGAEPAVAPIVNDLWQQVKNRVPTGEVKQALPTVADAVLSPRSFVKQKIGAMASAPAEARAAALNEEAARIASTGTTEKIPLEPSAPLNIPRPGVSPANQSLLDRLRSGTPSPEQEAAMEKAWANRGNFEPVPTPQEPYIPPQTVYKPPPNTGLPTMTPAVDAPTLNKAMNISEKQVARGANPGKRVLDEKLLGKTPEETADNVKMALDDSSGKLASALRKATNKGVKIDAQDTVLEALNDAQKRIGTPRDMIFQNQLNGVLDDIMKRYPKLDSLTPEQGHALKVELGDAIHWSGPAYDAPVNRAMVRIYSEMNSQLKDIEGVAAEQSRWGDLYNASKGLKKTLDRKLVGRGSWLQP